MTNNNCFFQISCPIISAKVHLFQPTETEKKKKRANYTRKYNEINCGDYT